MEIINNCFFHWLNVVVTAQFHNPSILNPDFLIRNKIMKDDFEVLENITTPSFSLIKYKNGIHITVTEHRFEVKEEINSYKWPNGSDIYRIASSYIELLRFVNYKSLGLNWSITYVYNEPKDWIINNLLNQKYLIDKSEVYPLINTDVNLTYDYKNTTCNIKISDTEFKESVDMSKQGINFNFNFSHATENHSISYDELMDKINSWKPWQDVVATSIQSLLER